MQAGVPSWSSSSGGTDAVTTSTPSVHHHSSVQLYNDVNIGGVSQASSLSAVYRSSVVSQQVITAVMIDSVSAIDATGKRKASPDNAASEQCTTQYGR